MPMGADPAPGESSNATSTPHIGGYTGARSLDKVLLGVTGNDGLLRYAGSVGTGLFEMARFDLYWA
jgi:hypothetical protein